jgi:hypothetical protein
MMPLRVKFTHSPRLPSNRRGAKSVRSCAWLLLLAMTAACGREQPPAPQPDPDPPIIKADNPAPEPPPEPAEGPRWRHQDALDRAVRFVLDTQKRAGDWGTMESRPRDIYLGTYASLHVWGNASSALCVMGLLMQPPAPELDAALERALEYLIDAPVNLRVTGDTFYNVWAHTYMIHALTAALADPRFADKRARLRKRAEQEVQLLIRHQALDGGWGYFDFRQRMDPPSGEYSTSFNTAAALVALHEARRAGLTFRDHTVQAALDYVQRHRIPNGAYFYSSGHIYYPQSPANLPRGSIARSQSGDNALITWQRQLTAEDARAALDYFFKDHLFLEIGRGRQMPHEAWYAVAPYYYYFGHYYAARNVALLPEVIRPEYARKLAELVVAGQYEDGSFWDYPLYGYTKAYGTGYGAAILSILKQAEQPDLARK